MAKRRNNTDNSDATSANVGYEAQLWQMADVLRGSMDAAEYKHVVLGLIFLKYISDAFEEHHAKLLAEQATGADPEDPDEYRAQSIFWVPPEARWAHLKAQAKQPTVGRLVDDAMTGIERDNPALKSVLPKDYARPALDKSVLGRLIDLISNIKVGDEEARAKDVLGRVYEYFLSQFASAEGKKGGEFYTPRCVVKLLVEMLEPYRGRVYDPCCGSSGMFVQSVEHILAQENGKERCIRAVRELSQAFALAVPHEEALRIRDDVAFFQAVQAVLAKRAPADARPEEDLDHAVRQIISRAVAPEGVVDIFAAAGLEKPDISILSDEFLVEVRGMPQRNLAVELLQKLLKGELKTRRRKNVVQARSFAEMLEQTLRKYQNRAIEAAQVIEELIQLARDMRDANARGEQLGLSEDELAFYDALETNDSAVKVLGDETLRGIARELVETVRNNVTIDWTLRENVRAQLRVLVKRILRKHGYPPDKQEKATQTVLEQAALLSGEWATV